MSDPKEDFHILALSGGGFKGLYTATVLAGLEQQIGGPIASRMDLLCGTSIGGIIALALAFEIPATNICEMFKVRGKEIFPSKPFGRFSGLFSPRHKNNGLIDVLTDLFGEYRIKDLRHRIVIPSVNFTKGKGQFFKTQHHPNFKIDGMRKLVDVALATSAAPIYLPMHAASDGLFVDGGLVGNAPGFFGLHEATKFLEIERHQIRVLSIGTLSKKLTARSGEKIQAGLLAWNVRLLTLMISAQESSTDFLLRHHLEDRYCQIDAILSDEQARGVGLDIVNKHAIQILEQRGKLSTQEFLGTKNSDIFLKHIAAEPVFFQNGEQPSKILGGNIG